MFLTEIFNVSAAGIGLDCTLLLLAQSGVYLYCMFSAIGSYELETYNSKDELD